MGGQQMKLRTANILAANFMVIVTVYWLAPKIWNKIKRNLIGGFKYGRPTNELTDGEHFSAKIGRKLIGVKRTIDEGKTN